MKNIILFVFIVIVFAACNNKNETTALENYTKPMIVNYYLRTDKSDFVTGEAYIYHEKDTIPPNIESATLNGKTMLESKIHNNTVLRMKIDEEFPKTEKYKFVINHSDDTPIEANFSPKPIKSFKVKEGVVSISNGFTLEWNGANIAKTNETLILLITDANGQSASLNRLGETAASGLEVDPVQLKYYNFTTGEGTLYLVRKTIIDLPQSSYYKQKAEVEYYTDEIKINIVE